MHILGTSIATVVIMVGAAAAHAGPDWIEIGDAGDSFSSAQSIAILGQLQSVSGRLSASGLGPGDYEDCYLFKVTDPSTFLITTAGLEVQLSIFRLLDTESDDVFEAFGVLANFNGPGPAILTRLSTDTTGAQITDPGTYMLAVSLEGRVPFSSGGDIFNFASPTETSGPDGPGGDSHLIGWYGESTASGEYSLTIRGAAGTGIPTPGATALLVFAAFGATRRRQR